MVYAYVRDPRKVCELNAKKEAERRRKDRMGTVPLSGFSRHRASAADGDRGGRGVLDGGFGRQMRQEVRRGGGV